LHLIKKYSNRENYLVDQLRSALVSDEEAVLAARAAWLYFAGGQTQAQIAQRLNVPNSKAHRLIARASREGLIRVFVEGPIAGCVALEEQLKTEFGLGHCEVVPNIDEGPLPLRTLGTAGARYLRNVLDHQEHGIIAVGHGRTLAAAIDFLPARPAEGVRFVSLLGGLTRRLAANPFDVIHRLAERTGAEAYVMPVPFFANSVEDKAVLLSQYGVPEVVALARSASLLIAGIGEVNLHAFLASGGMVGAEEIETVAEAGGCGEILGHFFDENGAPVPTELSDRALAPDLDALRGRKIVALAGGTTKVRAVRAILRSHLLYGLITDETTARSLVDANPEGQSGKNRSGKTALAEVNL
jgi:DNA-binding transcriptional regulator LsrR (DeoR family)